MAKYKNKDTGVIVEAMQIEYSCQDILDFGGGLIRSIQSTGLLSRRMDTFDLEINREYASPWHFICKTGDYLVKKDTSIFALHEKEFKKCFELVVGENDNMKNKDKYYVNIYNGNIVKAIKSNDYDGCCINTKDFAKQNPDTYIFKENNGTYTALPEYVFESCFSLIEADERTITKDTTNDKAVPNININIDTKCENPRDIADAIKRTLSKDFEKYMKECGIVEAELPKKDTYNPLPEKDIFGPVESATATLKAHERTVRDCILDMMIQEKANKLQDNCFLYLKERINELNKSISNGFTNNMESYKKYVGTLNKLRDIEYEDFMEIKERELKEALGFSSDIRNDHMLYNIELIAKRVKTKEDSKCTNEQ